MINSFKDDILLPFVAGLAAIAAALLIILAGILTMQWMFEPSPEARAAARVPVAIGSAEGCTVYRFEDRGTHYFTRCGEQVTTTKNYTESCGKACSRRRTEEITTEGNK